MLNARHFRKLAKRSATDADLNLYQPIGYPLVLRSKKDDRDLASVHIVDASDNNIKPVIMKLPDSNNRYQIVFGKNDTNVCFVITNFCHEGYVKLDLMRDDRIIDEVDPGGINQVNEVRPYESYEIRSDFTNQNRQVIVSKKKTSSGKHVKLEEDEKKSAGEKVGDYIYLTVTPRNGVPAFKEYFKETYWVVPDYVIVHSPKPTHSTMAYSRSIYSSGAHLTMDYMSEGLAAVAAVPIHTARGSSSSFKKEECDSEESVGSAGGGLFGDDEYEESHEMPKSKSIAKMMPKFEACDTSFMAKGGERKSRSATVSAPLKVPTNVAELSSIVSSASINTSHVAGIRHGEILSVNSADTGVEYLYDLHSPKCIIGMSIIDDLVVGSPASMDILEASGVLKEYAERLDKKLFEEIKIFEQGSCAVCLDEKADVVLLRCGHACVCSMECAGPLDKCPLCRVKIVGKIEKSKLTVCI